MLNGLADAQPAVECTGDPDDDPDRPAAEVARLIELVADDRELAQRRVHHLLLQAGVAGQDHPKHSGQQQQKREQRQERVVGDQRRQIAALVVDVLVDHRDDKPGGAASPL